VKEINSYFQFLVGKVGKFKGYFNFKRLKICAHANGFYNFCISSVLELLLNLIGHSYIKNYIHIVLIALTWRAFFYVEIAYDSYSTATKLLLILALIKGFYIRLGALLQY
jgi:hypothetical protein